MVDQIKQLELKSILSKWLSTFKEPIIFRNMLLQSNGSFEWQLLRWSLSELIEKFGDKLLEFRIGDHNKRTCSLQHRNWKVSPPENLINFTFKDFVEKTTEMEYNKWLYYDYKNMHEFFGDRPEIINSFNWLKFGIDEKMGQNGSNSTIWIGSKGAHTDCHQDTYGYNLVAQVYGRKLWLLYPPDADLKAVRLPYEESTVYSRYNMYCLSEEEEDYLSILEDKPKLITLEPGDVLFVPNGWWHYVESLDFVSISVNIWGKLKQDHQARVKEALVQLLIAKLGDYEQFEVKNTTHYTIQVENAIEKYVQVNNKQKNKNQENIFQKPIAKRIKSEVWTAKSLAEKYPKFVQLVPDAENIKFRAFLEERRNRDRFKCVPDVETGAANCIPNPQYDSFFESIVNALCHPEVISKAAEILIDRH